MIGRIRIDPDDVKAARRRDQSGRWALNRRQSHNETTQQTPPTRPARSSECGHKSSASSASRDTNIKIPDSKAVRWGAGDTERVLQCPASISPHLHGTSS
ncbi:hypothetical protein GDI0374 [Gluconacetobacter diazotrophicus PA1 5]|uniref:Uncharacterized protein n=1 Tax=Gluconacetobacter diazotrophicus (strain ATCC 49037 / DSM 5601 / CCUG 37298 / CIP 103539 / LMG 7603 / PAl5) TaxID=272568 RepID=A9H5D3_GLUDA|nr:hypothetical protein GDI0374 [Gluconacetobacter diazotrophicus PA1 5]